MSENLAGKTALVTGGAKGIGSAICWSLANNGCKKVIVLDKDREALHSMFTDRYRHPSFFAMCLDITKRDLVRKKLRPLHVDILVNNAAITQGDDHEAIMRVNVDGTRYVTEALLPQMKERKSGSVVFVTSVHTALAFRGDAAYDSSKHAVVGYMRARAIEYARYGVRLNAVAPGAIILAGSNVGLKKDVVKKVANKIPAKRWGEPREIAEVVAFLASNLASYVVGAEIRVDGGMSVDSQFR